MSSEGGETALSIQSDDSSDEDELFNEPKGLIRIVIEYASHVSSPSEHVIHMLRTLESIPKLIKFKDYDVSRNFFQEVVSLGQELKVFFKVPNQHIMSNISPTLNRNQVVSVFINFLLLMVECILCFKADIIACVKGLIQNLRTELGFLITFLGDAGMHSLPTKNIVVDVETMVNEVGSFLYSFFFTIVLFIPIEEEIDNEVADLEDMVNEVGSFLHSNLFTFLEDILLQTTEVMDIKALAHEIGSFIVFTKNDQVLEMTESGILDLALSDLLTKFELLKSKIKDHCITVSEMPSDMAPKTVEVSLFIVDSVLDDLMDLINNKSDRIVGLNDQIVMLHEELMLLGSSITSKAMQQEAEQEELIIKTRDIAYEVEYVINSFPPVWYLTLRLPQLIEKIHLLRMDIDVAGMPQIAKYSGEHLWLQSKEPPILEDIVEPPILEDIVVGFDNVTKDVAEQLVRGTVQLRIITISGMPGLGKTTLANKLYNYPSVVDHFDKRAWCVVSQTYSKKNILINILIKQETIAYKDEESLAEDVYKSLKGRRYLIVMDDIWDTEVWDDLKRYFPNDGVGSRILFTTRNKEVGSNASPHSHSVINTLPFLSEGDSWELLRKKVFTDKSCPQDLLDIGKQIAKNCHGLPLAVVVIAGVLAKMEKKEHLWQKVARNLNSHISENRDNCIGILELSYEHLPMHLKPCFLYFGAFEEDEVINIRKLISLWVAQGYIKKEEHKSSEDVALAYVTELIDRSLILVAEKRFDGSIKTCKIHDLLREMCSRIAEEKNFLKIVNFNDNLLSVFSQQLMYQQHNCLSINYERQKFYSLPFGPHVRSLLCCNDECPKLVSCSFKILRVLDFYGNFEVVTGIEHLVHLRYLAISCTLPPMESFHKLEFLVVSNSDEVEIPDVLLNMMSLRHMHFEGGAYFSESIRHRAIMDKNFQINNNLRSIYFLRIFDKTDEKILRCSPDLRRLKGRVRSSQSYSFDFLNQLESLKLSSFIQGSSFNLIVLPLNLKKLTLVDARVSSEQMEIIAKLKYLEVLKLSHVYFEGEQWNTSEGEFPQLKFLELSSVVLAKWNTSGDHLPELQQLVLKYCYDLEMIHPSLGEIPTLLMIEVHGCTEAIEKSAKVIQEEQKEIGNEFLKVIISGW